MLSTETLDLLLGNYGFPITVAITSVVSLVFLVLKHDSQAEKRERRIQKEAKDREERQQIENIEREKRLLDDLKKREMKESVAFVESRMKSGSPGLRFICGKNRVSPGEKAQELFFSQGVHSDVCIARIFI